MLVSNQSLSQSRLQQVVNQAVIQSVSQSFNQSFDHSIIHSIKGGLIILFMQVGQGTRMILDFFPLRFLEAPTPLSYNLGWCYFPPSLIPSPTNVHKIPDPQTNPPPPTPLRHHHHANDESGLQKYCLKHIDSQKHFFVYESPINNYCSCIPAHFPPFSKKQSDNCVNGQELKLHVATQSA